MKIDDTVFFTSCNDGYLKYAVATLLLLRERLPGAKLAVLCEDASERSRRILQKFDILHINKSYREEFYKVWEYPAECYYIFAGPEEFGRRGYKYSVYVDGDVACMSDKVLLDEVSGVAGVAANTCEEILGGDVPVLKKCFGLGERRLRRARVQSGVVYFNNEYCRRVKLLERAVEVFDTAVKKGVPRKGDDSLFALLQVMLMGDKDLKFLGSEYNYIMNFNNNQLPDGEVVFFHFTTCGQKPWERRRGDDLDKYKRPWQEMLRRVSLTAYLGMRWK